MQLLLLLQVELYLRIPTFDERPKACASLCLCLHRRGTALRAHGRRWRVWWGRWRRIHTITRVSASTPWKDTCLYRRSVCICVCIINVLHPTVRTHFSNNLQCVSAMETGSVRESWYRTCVLVTCFSPTHINRASEQIKQWWNDSWQSHVTCWRHDSCYLQLRPFIWNPSLLLLPLILFFCLFLLFPSSHVLFLLLTFSPFISLFPSGSFVSTWVKYYCTYHREPKRVTMVLFDPKSVGKMVSSSGHSNVQIHVKTLFTIGINKRPECVSCDHFKYWSKPLKTNMYTNICIYNDLK